MVSWKEKWGSAKWTGGLALAADGVSGQRECDVARFASIELARLEGAHIMKPRCVRANARSCSRRFQLARSIPRASHGSLGAMVVLASRRRSPAAGSGIMWGAKREESNKIAFNLRASACAPALPGQADRTPRVCTKGGYHQLTCKGSARHRLFVFCAAAVEAG
jgi:hypothetical protein